MWKPGRIPMCCMRGLHGNQAALHLQDAGKLPPKQSRKAAESKVRLDKTGHAGYTKQATRNG